MANPDATRRRTRLERTRPMQQPSALVDKESGFWLTHLMARRASDALLHRATRSNAVDAELVEHPAAVLLVPAGPGFATGANADPSWDGPRNGVTESTRGRDDAPTISPPASSSCDDG